MQTARNVLSFSRFVLSRQPLKINWWAGVDGFLTNLLHQLFHLFTPTCGIHFLQKDPPLVKMQHRCITVYSKCFLSAVSPLSRAFSVRDDKVCRCLLLWNCKRFSPAFLSKVCPLLPGKDNYYVKKNKFCCGVLTLPPERFSGDYRGKHYPPSQNNNPGPWSILMNRGALRSLKANSGCAGVLFFSLFFLDNMTFWVLHLWCTQWSLPLIGIFGSLCVFFNSMAASL